MTLNFYAGWLGFLVGCVAGAIPGLLFHNKDWLGGYDSWQRRMIRLAHISFFGIGFLNLLFALTVRSLVLEGPQLKMASVLLVVGIVAMPTVCYLSAWRQFFRHIFFIPALSVITSITLLLWRMFTS